MYFVRTKIMCTYRKFARVLLIPTPIVLYEFSPQSSNHFCLSALSPLPDLTNLSLPIHLFRIYDAVFLSVFIPTLTYLLHPLITRSL